MPFLFIIVGTVMVVSAARNTTQDLLTLLKGDFTGKGNYLYWLLSILVIGAVGYVPDLKPVSRAFLVLVLVVLFINNRGVFAQFTSAINTTQSNSATPSTLSSNTATPTLGGITSLPPLTSL